MSILDIILAALLGYGLYNGLKNGLFVELASLVALVIGIYFSLKFSFIVRGFLEDNVSWSAKYVQIAAFAITFIGTVVSIHLLAKTFTKLADFAHLGWLNKLGGAGFSMLKTALALSIIFNIFQKINVNNMIVSQENLDSSVFYNPIQDVSKIIYPTLEEWYNEFKSKTADQKNKI
jgi:membrane protein required for colicin V production